MDIFDLPSSGLKSAWTKVARLSENLKIIHLYPLVGLFVYLLMFW